jgi:hypothetical protein
MMSSSTTTTDTTTAIDNNNANDNMTAAPPRRSKHVGCNTINNTRDPNTVSSPVALDSDEPCTELSMCHSMANTSMKYCLIDVVIYITTI